MAKRYTIKLVLYEEEIGNYGSVVQRQEKVAYPMETSLAMPTDREAVEVLRDLYEVCEKKLREWEGK
jgi:hypothetical protein